MKDTTRIGFLLMVIMIFSLSFYSCKDGDVEDHSLEGTWVSGHLSNSDHTFCLWIKNDSLFSFQMLYNVYDGVSWYEISGVKTYTGHYSIDGKKLVMISDSMFFQKDLSVETIDTIAITQTLFKDCEYQITGNQLQLDFEIELTTPPTIQRTISFNLLEY